MSAPASIRVACIDIPFACAPFGRGAVPGSTPGLYGYRSQERRRSGLLRRRLVVQAVPSRRPSRTAKSARGHTDRQFDVINDVRDDISIEIGILSWRDLQISFSPCHVGEPRQVQLMRDGHRLGRAVTMFGQNEVRFSPTRVVAVECIWPI